MLNKLLNHNGFCKIFFILPLILSVALGSWFYTISVNSAQEKVDIIYSGLVATVQGSRGVANTYKDNGDWTQSGRVAYLERTIPGFQNRASGDHIIAFIFDNQQQRHSIVSSNTMPQDWCPLQDDAFLEAITNNESGEILVNYRNTHVKLFYQWVPDNEDKNMQYLFVVGVCPELLGIYLIGSTVSMIIMFLIILLMQYNLVAAILYYRKRCHSNDC